MNVTVANKCSFTLARYCNTVLFATPSKQTWHSQPQFRHKPKHVICNVFLVSQIGAYYKGVDSAGRTPYY